MSGKGRILFFCTWLSSFPNAIYGQDFPFPIEYFWLPCQTLVHCIYGDFYLGSVFCFIGVFYASSIPFWLLSLCSLVWNQKMWYCQLFCSFLRLPGLWERTVRDLILNLFRVLRLVLDKNLKYLGSQ